MVDVGLLRPPAEETEGEPRRDRKGDDQREQHGGRGIDRNRPHVGTHQAAHKGERHEGRDDGEGGEDGRVADLVDRVDGGQPCSRPPELDVTVDVLYDHDSVVDEDPDRKHQGEETHPVEGVAKEIRRGQGQGEGHRDDDGDHGRLAPRQRDPHQEDDGDRRGPEVLEQLAGLLIGGGAVIAGLEHLDVGGNHPAGQSIEHLVEIVHHLNRVRAGLLGHRNSHCRKVDAGTLETLLRGRRPGAEPHVRGGFLRTVENLCHVLEIDRATAIGRNYEVPNL